LRTADEYRADAEDFEQLARKIRDPQLKKHYADLAAAFRALADAHDRGVTKRASSKARSL
jgi:hypothetical protein